MADGVTLQSATLASPAAGTEVATDDCGADGHAQIVKLAISADGSVTLIPGDASNGLDVDVTRIAAGDNLVGRVKISDGTDVLAVNADGSINISGTISAGVDQNDLSVNSAGLTTAATAYSAGDVLGSGWEITNAASASGGFGAITGVTLVDKADITSTVELWVAAGSVTFGTDNAVPSISDSDAEKIIPGGFVSVPMTDLGGVRVGTAANLWIPYKADATSIYVYGTTRTDHTFFGAVTDLRLRVTFVQL